MGIILIGGGGLALEIASYILDLNSEIKILGYLDDKEDCAIKRHHRNLIYFGSLFTNNIPLEAALIIGVNDVLLRRKLFLHYKSKLKNSFFTFVHPTAYVASSAKIGEGCVIAPHSIVSSNSVLSDNVLLNVFCGIGHESLIGSHTVLSPYTVVNGSTNVGESCFFGSRATLFQDLKIGNYCTIDAGSILRESLPDYTMVRNQTSVTLIDDKIKRRLNNTSFNP
jgi:sugar O-acyltransferase (sialic acid O-acetyltransferase NeuD family)